MHAFRSLQAESRSAVLGVFLAALLVRVAYLVDIRDNPFFATPVIDAEFYHQQAAALAGGGGWSRAPFQMPPLWPLLLGLAYRLLGVDIWIAHGMQVLLGAGTAALTYAIGRRLGGAAVGLVAAAFVVSSKMLLFLEGDLLATPLALFLNLVATLCLARYLQDGERARDAILGGAALGLSALAVPSVLAVLPPVAVWLAWRRRRPRAAALVVAAALAAIAPATLRNRVTSGEWVLVSANGGINFYMGNNPDMHRTVALRPGPEWGAMQDLPVLEAGLVASSARDRWFVRRGLRFWIEDPVRALAHTGAKVLQLVHDHETMRDVDFYWFRDHYSGVLRLPGWSFALLLGLAVVGLAVARAGTPAERLLQILLASYAAGIVLFFVTARYRAPLLPFLAVFAARGAVELVARARAGAWPRTAGPAVLLVAVLALSHADVLGGDRVDEIEARYRVATTFEKRGRLEEALRRYDEVLAEAPDHLLAGARAALCAQLLGRLPEAVDRYMALLERHPGYVDAAVNLATLAWQHGEPEAARHYFEVALAASPVHAQAHAAHGHFLLAHGEPAAAVAALERALHFDPFWESLRLDLVRAYLAAGHPAAARSEFDRAMRLLPVSDYVQLVRGDLLLAEGSADAARAAWEAGLRLNPENADLRQRLGQALPSP